MKTVLFLGAGFSAPFGQPTMNRFMHYAQSHLDEEDRLFLLDLVLDARRANSMLESSPTNLEDILSFAVMGDRLGLYGDVEEPSAPKLKRILRYIYSRVPKEDETRYLERYSLFKSFLGIDKPRELQNYSIITTNYDVNIESALHAWDSVAKLPFEFNSQKGGRSLSAWHQGVPLFKLHGSVNWYESDDDTVYVQNGFGSRHSEMNMLPETCLDFFNIDQVPIIIPPTFLKPDIDGILSEVWAGAANALNNAEVVVFVGYSFPESDVEMKYFLARSLMDNGSLRQIIIVDLYADQIVERLNANDSGFGSHFKSFLEPKSGDWTKQSLRRQQGFSFGFG